MTISPGIYRNTPKRLKWPETPEILSEVEWEVTLYRFAYQYEIFRPFRPERNGINNFGFKSGREKIYQ